MAMTMFDYIRKQAEVLPEILAGRENIAARFRNAYRPERVKKILLIASGSSYNEGVTARYFMEKYMQKEVQVKVPYAFTHYETIFEPHTLVVGISQSGRSTAVIDALKKAERSGFATVAVTADESSELAKVAAHTVVVPCGKETVDYVTLGFTSTVLTLMLMALEAGRYYGTTDEAAYRRALDSLSRSLEAYDRNIAAADRWVERNLSDLAGADRMMVIAYGPNLGTAMEGCLKMGETVRNAVSFYELEEFMHGPHLELNSRSCVIFIASRGAGEERIRRLRDFVDTVTPYRYTIGYETGDRDGRNAALDANGDEDVSPLDYVIPLQVLAYRLAVAKGMKLEGETFPDFKKYVRTRA